MSITLRSHCRVEMGRPWCERATGVGLNSGGEAVGLLAAGLGSLAGDGQQTGVAGAVGDGRAVVSAPAAVA